MIPTPKEVEAAQHELRRRIDSLRNRVIERLHKPARGDGSYSVELHLEWDEVVAAIIAELADSGWKAVRDRVATQYGAIKAHPLTGRMEKSLIDPGHDDLIITKGG